MRALTSTHIFAEQGEELYAHNTLSRAFIDQSNRDMFQQMYEYVGRGVYAHPQFLEETGWKNPEHYDDCSFQLGHGTKLGFWYVSRI
jgi:hypothetical protein